MKQTKKFLDFLLEDDEDTETTPTGTEEYYLYIGRCSREAGEIEIVDLFKKSVDANGNVFFTKPDDDNKTEYSAFSILSAGSLFKLPDLATYQRLLTSVLGNSMLTSLQMFTIPITNINKIKTSLPDNKFERLSSAYSTRSLKRIIPMDRKEIPR